MAGSLEGGSLQRVDAAHITRIDGRFERDVEFSRKAGEHFWTAFAVHRMSDQMARSLFDPDSNTEPIFDLETLQTVEFGCYICEQALNPRLVGKRCKGEPKDSVKHGIS